MSYGNAARFHRQSDRAVHVWWLWSQAGERSILSRAGADTVRRRHNVPAHGKVRREVGAPPSALRARHGLRWIFQVRQRWLRLPNVAAARKARRRSVPRAAPSPSGRLRRKLSGRVRVTHLHFWRLYRALHAKMQPQSMRRAVPRVHERRVAHEEGLLSVPV